MSAIPNPTPLPQTPEKQAAPRIVPPAHLPGEPSRKRFWVALILIVVLAAGTVMWMKGRGARQTATASPDLRTLKVSSGPIERVLRIAGSTAARNFAQITAPMMRGPDSGRALVLIEVVKSGAYVKKGERIAQIDAQSVKDHVDDIDSQVQQAEADIKKRRAEQAIEMENLRQNLRVAQANLEKAKLDAGASPIRTDIDREILTLAVEEAQATLKEQQTDLVTTDRKQKSEIRILEYTRDRHARHRDRHKADVERFTIHAPIGGLVVMQSIWRGGEMGQVQQGDQLNPGQPFIKIVDTNSMQLEAMVNQSESQGLRIGQPAELRFDAFPDLRLEGKIYSVGAMAVQGWRENYFIRNIPVRVSILGRDARVIPDLSSSADVSLDRSEKAVVVPLEAVQNEGGKPVVFVKSGDSFVERAVDLGVRNNLQAAVIAGLQPGEEVALGRPRSATP